MAELQEAAWPFMESGGRWQHLEVIELVLSWLAVDRSFISLCPSFLICKMGMIAAPPPIGVVVIINGATVRTLGQHSMMADA